MTGRPLALAAALLLPAPAPAPRPAAEGPPPAIVRRGAGLDALFPPGAAPEKVADGFAWVEGPLWDARRNGLLFSDIPANAILLWRPGAGTSRLLSPSGYTGARPFPGREPGSNGLAFDAEGRLVFCAHGDRAIVRIERDGGRTLLASRFDGRRLNSPNDLVVGPDGALTFTDPPFGLPATFEDPEKELPWSGVYRLEAGAGGRLSLLTSELRAPNGLAYSPDGRTLYVSNADAARAVWMAFPVRPDGTLGNGRVFFDATPWARAGTGNPDGLKVDARGNLFAAGPGGGPRPLARGIASRHDRLRRPRLERRLGRGRIDALHHRLDRRLQDPDGDARRRLLTTPRPAAAHPIARGEGDGRRGAFRLRGRAAEGASRRRPLDAPRRPVLRGDLGELHG